MKNIVIDGENIGLHYSPYIVAEMSANHNGQLSRAKKIISEAKRCGANAVKIQTYRPETITVKSNNPEFMIYSGLWAGKNLYELYESAYLPWEWHKELFNYAKSIGITIFSSPFDSTAVDLLESLDCPAYKIASFELIDIPLLKYVASTKKPIIMSTGMASEEEIALAVKTLRENGTKELILLGCVSEYPADPASYNLSTMPDMRNKFACEVGLSDHTLNSITAIASIALGAVLIEKHFTLDRFGGGPDDQFSIMPEELMDLCFSAKVAWSSIGSIKYGTKDSESSNLQFRRSIYIVKPIKKGEKFTKDNIKCIRPGFGMEPKFYEDILGCVSTANLDENIPMKPEYMKNANN